MDFWTVTIFKVTLGSGCLEPTFWTADFKPELKNNAMHMPSLNLTPNLFLDVYTHKKIKTIAVVGILVFLTQIAKGMLKNTYVKKTKTVTWY